MRRLSLSFSATLYNVLKVGRQSSTPQVKSAKEVGNCLARLNIRAPQGGDCRKYCGRRPKARYITSDNVRRKVPPGVRCKRPGNSTGSALRQAGVSILI